VRPAAIAPSRSTPAIEEVTSFDWSNSSLMPRPGGAAARATSRNLRTPLTTATVEALPFLRTLSSTERRPSLRTTFCLHGPAVMHLADIPEQHRLPIDVFDWNIVEVSDAHWHRIGPHRVLRVADLGRDRMAKSDSEH